MPNIIQPSFEILEYPQNVLEKIERVARTCYKSEDKIGPGSAEKLVRKLLTDEHYPMIEFGGWIVVKFYSNRGFTHEAVRHRIVSAAQESTRYCNYVKEKFGTEITVVDPEKALAMKVKDAERRALIVIKMVESWARAEHDYIYLVSELGCPAEMAREVLPIGLKAELVIGATVREWRHIMKMRTSNKAHPRMRELMRPLLVKFRELMPIVFDDVGSLGLWEDEK